MTESTVSDPIVLLTQDIDQAQSFVTREAAANYAFDIVGAGMWFVLVDDRKGGLVVLLLSSAPAAILGFAI